MLSRVAAGCSRKYLLLFQNSLSRGLAAQASQHVNHSVTLSRRMKSSLDLPYDRPFTKDIPQFGEDRGTENLNKLPDFRDTKLAYDSKATTELVRAALCLRLCRLPYLVENAENILNMSRSIVGGTITDAVVRSTFFRHFCAGEHEKDIRPVVKLLGDAGIRSVLYYAAENDDNSASSKLTVQTPISLSEVAHNDGSAGEYTRDFEDQANEHMKTYIDGINNMSNLGSEEGYAAIKITALGDPKLLRRISQTITETKRLFKKFDLNRDGKIGRDEFEKCYRYFFNDADTRMKDLFEQLDPDHDDQVDYITWSMTLSPKDISQFTSNCKEVGPLYLATPTAQELELMDSVYDRARSVAQAAAQTGVRLLMDAEQVRFQPAIDNLVLDLQQQFNSPSNVGHPIIYNTYQCYRKDAMHRLKNDVERSMLFDYHFGAKLVRGAYMDSERDLATKSGLPSPIHDTIEDTHQCYNSAVEFLLQKSLEQQDRKLEIMCATHNQDSIEKAIDAMNRYGIDGTTSNPTLRFAQLYAMADHLSFSLGNHGYAVYKYLPYGDIQQVTAFLLRRAQENGAVLGGTSADLGLIESELRRRFMAGLRLA